MKQHLEKSAKLGHAEAYYSLGMTYLTQNNMELALKNLELYKANNPKNKDAQKIIEAIKSGNIQIKQNNMLFSYI